MLMPDLGPDVECLWSSPDLGASIVAERAEENGTVWVWLALWLRRGIHDAMPLADDRLEQQIVPARDGSEAAWTVVRYAPVDGGPANVDGADDDVCGVSVADVMEDAREQARDLRRVSPWSPACEVLNEPIRVFFTGDSSASTTVATASSAVAAPIDSALARSEDIGEGQSKSTSCSGSAKSKSIGSLVPLARPFPFRLTPFAVDLSTVAWLNDIGHRSNAAAFLTVEAALTRIASTVPAVPDKLRSLVGHPDERVVVAFFRSPHRRSLDQRDLNRAAVKALDGADNWGILWTQSLDAIAGQTSLNLCSADGFQTSIDLQAVRVLEWLEAHDSQNVVEQLAQYESCLMLRCIARSSYLTADVVRHIVSVAARWRAPERLVLSDLVANAALPTGARSVVINHLVNVVRKRGQSEGAEPRRVINFAGLLATAIGRGFEVTSRQVCSLITRYARLGNNIGMHQSDALRDALDLAVRSVPGGVPATALKPLHTSVHQDCRLLGFQLLAVVRQVRPRARLRHK